MARLTEQQGLELYRSCGLAELGMRADAVARQLHGGDERTYVVERNINYTNICNCRCRFCAFSASAGSDSGYTLSIDEICEKVVPLVELGGRQILLQGGMNPGLGFDWYEKLLAELKSRWPELHIHGLSPPEIVFFGKHFDMSVAVVIERLHKAGLDTIAGGGAEILLDRVRKLVSPGKCSAGQWVDVMRQCHRQGICSSATMMFGHLETIEERMGHLEVIRRLQDESLDLREKDSSVGYFTSFTCWPFQAGNNRLGRFDEYNPDPESQRGEKQLVLAGASEQLKMMAMSRLYLDNIANIQASWVTQGPAIGQLSLLMGCNDIGSLMMEENVVAAAGTTYKLGLSQLRQLIRQAGFEPVQRDYYYNVAKWNEGQG